MKYWFASANRDNWGIVQKECVWGIPTRNVNLISRIHKGDKILFFVRQEKIGDQIYPSSVVGEAIASTEGYEDKNPIFKKNLRNPKEIFPHRIRLERIKVFTTPIEFKPLVESLSFIKNKKMWTGHIRVAMRGIPEEDYQKIIRQLN